MGRANGVSTEDRDHLVGKDVLPGMGGSRPTKASPRSASDSSMVARCDSPVFEQPPSEEETEAALSILKQYELAEKGDKSRLRTLFSSLSSSFIIRLKNFMKHSV
ncbi:hypothetical protein BHE74_00021824 [Ensete ventricosum]|nr:hypothetical protein BHE74_00021824 [Ensete ventricosum]